MHFASSTSLTNDAPVAVPRDLLVGGGDVLAQSTRQNQSVVYGSSDRGLHVVLQLNHLIRVT